MYARLKYVNKIWPGTRGSTTPVNNRPAKGKGPATRLSAEWMDLIRSVNTPAAAQFLFSPRSGWVNADYQTTPLAESISFGGNVVRVIERKGKFSFVDSLLSSEPTLARVLYADPDEKNLFWHRFTCLDTRNRIVNPGANLEVTLPFITAGPAWIENKLLDFFDEMPEPVWPKVSAPVPTGPKIFVAKGTPIYQSPGAHKVDNEKAGQFYPVFGSGQHRGASYKQIGERRWVIG